MRSSALRLAAAASWLRDVVPLTGRGFAVGVMSAVAAWIYGRGALDLVLLVVGGAGLTLLAVAFVTVAGSAVVFTRRLRTVKSASVALESGRALPTGLSVPGLPHVPLLRITWDWREPRGALVRVRPQDGWLYEDVHATRRAHAHTVGRDVVVEDVLGLCRVRWRWTQPGPLTILPDPGPLRGMPIVQAIAGGDAVAQPLGKPEGDRMDIRQYVPGDSVRNILWKNYARTRELTVRLPERATAPTRRMVAYLSSGPSDEAAAAAARVALEAGVLGPRWAFGADGTPDVIEDLGEALVAIARSGNTQGPHAIGTFLQRVMADGRAHCLVFAPPRKGPWLDAAIAAARRHPGVLSFVIGTDGVAQGRPVPAWQRALVAPAPDERPLAGEIVEVLRAIGEAGCSALVVDRQSGRAYGATHQQRLEALAR